MTEGISSITMSEPANTSNDSDHVGQSTGNADSNTTGLPLVSTSGKSKSKTRGKAVGKTGGTGGAGKSDRQLRQFAIDVARLLDDLHCEEIIVLDVQGKSQTVDYVVIATGTSDRQIRSMGESVQDLGSERGLLRFGREIDGRSSWVIVDFTDIVVHVFETMTRAHYDLEMMWGDAPRVRWKRVARKSTKAASPSEEKD
ncbi:MAG: ribosome silencing factor [Phycisphaerales bacterium]|nr:ribosome silencing factor [Phycisphaerales bacterium]